MQNGHIEENNGNKYLIFDDSVDENQVLIKKIRRCLEWNSKRNQINNCVKENGYGKDYMKIKFNSDDELPLKKPLKFYATNIIIRSVFEEVGKLYPQPF